MPRRPHPTTRRLGPAPVRERLIITGYKTGIRTDETTIYRTVAALEEVGLVHSVAANNRATRFGLADPAHHHAVCDRCGAIRVLPADRVHNLMAVAERTNGIRAASSAGLTVYGTCETCS